MPKIFASLTATALLLALPAHADDHCQLMEAVSVSMRVDDGGRITVPMSMTGKPVSMMVDTGSILSLLRFETAQALGFDIKHVEIGKAGVGIVTMYGGLTVTEYTKAKDVAIGQLRTDSMGFGILPGNLQEDVDGLIGSDILGNYDDDYDFANGKFNLFSKDHCAGNVVYWTRQPVAVVPFSHDLYGHIIVSVMLDGKNFDAYLDTGAYRSVAGWEDMHHAFGIDEKSAGVKQQGSADAPRYNYPFKALTFGGVTVNNPDLTLIPNSESGRGNGGNVRPTLIIGVNVLRQLHLYVAQGEKKLYITPASSH